MKLPKIRIGRAQRLAGVMLLVFLAQCSWVIGHQRLTAADYQYAECGREMWERPSPLAGYFTTCGNLHGDGTLAYRVAGLPLTMERLVLLGADRFRKPENRLYVGGTLNGSTWEARHQMGGVIWLMHLPFVLFAMWLGGGLWWVCRRLFGNEGAFFSLGLYCFSPDVVRYAVVPNNEVLAMWGLYGLVYTAIGVAHAMQGPRKKWRPRIVLLTVALGLTAAAHLVAAMVGFVAAFVLMMYLAERWRSHVMQILIFSALGALVVVFASFAFRAAAFSYVFTGGGAVLVLARWGEGVLRVAGGGSDHGGGGGGAGDVGGGEEEPLFWEYGASGDGGDCERGDAGSGGGVGLDVGGAVRVDVCRRRVRRRDGDEVSGDVFGAGGVSAGGAGGGLLEWVGGLGPVLGFGSGGTRGLWLGEEGGLAALDTPPFR